MLGGLPRSDDPRVLVDQSTGDDAGVFRLDERTTLVQTVDFFTPVVDDPEEFGAIAAANAVSDVYAMGGRPLTALSIAAFPEGDFPMAWARAIVRGGASKLKEAGCVLIGGHTVRDPEIKFGYAITGLVDPARMLTNAAGQPGDILVLTKPLGTGVIATALKAGEAPQDAATASAAAMLTLNRAAAEAAVRHGVRAATDITGFGLVGHAERHRPRELAHSRDRGEPRPPAAAGPGAGPPVPGPWPQGQSPAVRAPGRAPRPASTRPWKRSSSILRPPADSCFWPPKASHPPWFPSCPARR